MKHIAYIAFVLLGVIWGSNFLFTKWAAEWITPGQIVLLRVLFGFIPILLYALFSRALRWSHLRHVHHFLIMSLLATALYYYAYAKGTSLLLSSVAGMLSGAIPLFTFVCAFVFLRQEPLNTRTASGVALGFIGVLMIARPWASGVAAINVEGVLYTVLGSLSLGCSFVYAKRFLSTLDISPVALSTYQIGLALPMIAAASDWQGIAAITASPKAMLSVSLGLGVLGTGLAYILYYFIVQRLGALAAASVTYIPPVIALAIGVLIANEPVQGMDLLAVATIMAGVYVLQTGHAAPAPASIPLKATR